MTHPVRVAVFGCGLIGSRWDEARAEDAPSLTHGRAFSRHAGSRVVAFCDVDHERARAAAARWGGTAHADAAGLFAAHEVDLVVVASASAARSSVIEPALAAGVKTLVIEKPLAPTLAEAQRLAGLIDAAGARGLVNFSRHWDPSMQALGRQLRAGEFGAPQRMLGLYGKGLANCGSHMVDLARLLWQAVPVRARALGSPLQAGEADWSQGSDTAPDAQVELRDAAGRTLHLDLLGTDARDWFCFELRLICRDATVELTHGGRRIDVLPIAADPDYPGYRIPGPRQSLPARALESMDRMADEAIALARGDVAHARCDARNALLTALTVDAIRRSAAGGGWVEIEHP
jgi:predicted dehydrogenase